METTGELLARKGLCAGTLITLLASRAVAELVKDSAWEAAEAVSMT